MPSKTPWWLLGAILVATATATLAILEYAHRRPDSRVAQLLRRARLLSQPSSHPEQQPGTQPGHSSHVAKHSSNVPGPSLPPDVLEQGLRELKLLDQLAVQQLFPNPSVANNDGSQPNDEFAPEKIPVPPRLALADADTLDNTPVPDGRSLAPVVSLEVLPVAPRPRQTEPVPDDLDDETAERVPDDCHAEPEKLDLPSADTDSEDQPPREGKASPGTMGLCNSPGCVSDLGDCLSNYHAKLSCWLEKLETCWTRTAQVVEKVARLVAKQAYCFLGTGTCRERCDQARGCFPNANHSLARCCASADSRSCQEPAKVVRRVYPVGDLLETAEDGQVLRDLVAEFVRPYSWQSYQQLPGCSCSNLPTLGSDSPNDGEKPASCQKAFRGKIEYYPACRCLIVLHTPDVQKEVAAFLSELRRAARLAQSEPKPVHYGSAPCPLEKPERVIVLPVMRPVIVPVAVPVPVGVPDEEPSWPQFRIPQTPDDENIPEQPAHQLVPKTPERLPDCQRFPARLRANNQPWCSPTRGATPQVPLPPEITPRILPHSHTLPMLPQAPQQRPSNRLEKQHPDDLEEPGPEDFQPLETDLLPPIG